MSRGNTTELTTTSYGILGLLAIKPWTTYELAQQMDRGLGRLWPRARSLIYEEPKKLVVHGLAQAAKEMVGRRPRTVYTITPKGRRVLAAWLATPGEGPVVQFEQMMKVFFAEHGTKRDLLATLASMRRWAEAERAEHIAVARSYLAGLGAFPERTAVLVLTGRFQADFADLVGKWADWATGVVEGWPDDVRAAEPDWATLESIAATRERRAGRTEN